jgi:hypothetical protein
MNTYKTLAVMNPEKYPKNMGQSWDNDEMLLLLEEIRSGKDIKEIATIHHRTEGAIKAALRKQALTYYFVQRMPVEEILNLTKLSKDYFKKSILNDKRYKPSDATDTLIDNTFQGKIDEAELIPTGRKIKVKRKKVDDESVISLLKDIKSILLQLNEKIK